MPTEDAARPLSAKRSGPLKGTVRPPGDKSISHRALMLGALAIGETSIEGLLEGEDVLSTAEAMRAFGATVTRSGQGTWRVAGLGVGGMLEPDRVVDFGNAGTGARLTMGIAASHNFTTTFTGDASLVKRPMGRVCDPLRRMGVQILARAGDKLPATLKGPEALIPIEFRLNVPSAQVKSCVLLAALNSPGVTTIIEPTATRDHTERMLTAFGAAIEIETAEDGSRVVRLEGGTALKPQVIVVPSDPSSAAFLIAAATLIGGSAVSILNVAANWTRTGFIEIARRMGAPIDGAIEPPGSPLTAEEPTTTLEIAHGALRGVAVEPAEIAQAIDELPLVALLGCFAEGDTVVRGAQELRVKETDRIATVVEGLGALGAAIEATDDGFVVHGGGGLRGGVLRAHGDHRLAMLGAVAGLCSREGVEVVGLEAAAVSYPGFAGDLARLSG